VGFLVFWATLFRSKDRLWEAARPTIGTLKKLLQWKLPASNLADDWLVWGRQSVGGKPVQREHRDERLSFERRAWCEHQSVTLYLTVSNISRGGLFLQTFMPLLPGDTLDVSFAGTSEQDTIVARVQIVWVCRAGRGSGLGCRLIDLLQGSSAYEQLLVALGQNVSGEYSLASAG